MVHTYSPWTRSSWGRPSFHTIFVQFTTQTFWTRCLLFFGRYHFLILQKLSLWHRHASKRWTSVKNMAFWLKMESWLGRKQSSNKRIKRRYLHIGDPEMFLVQLCDIISQDSQKQSIQCHLFFCRVLVFWHKYNMRCDDLPLCWCLYKNVKEAQFFKIKRTVWKGWSVRQLWA